MYVCMYVCNVRTHAHTYVGMYVRTHAHTYVGMYVCMYVCRYKSTYVYMYVMCRCHPLIPARK